MLKKHHNVKFRHFKCIVLFLQDGFLGKKCEDNVTRRFINKFDLNLSLCTISYLIYFLFPFNLVVKCDLDMLLTSENVFFVCVRFEISYAWFSGLWNYKHDLCEEDNGDGAFSSVNGTRLFSVPGCYLGLLLPTWFHPSADKSEMPFRTLFLSLG